MKRGLPIVLLLLCGCGAEVVGTAATVGAARQAEVQQAQQTQQQFQQRLDTANEAARQNLEAADKAANQ